MKIFLSIPVLLITLNLRAQLNIPLYPNEIPNSKPSVDEEKTEQWQGITIISKISKPVMTAFLPQKGKSNGTAIIIFPGGGYSVNAHSHEGTEVATRLNEMGIAAFVVKYRIPSDETMSNKEIGPLQDAQQAIKMVRERSKEWDLNPDRIGIMGFSAGGHLASTAGTHFNSPVIENTKGTSLRPDFLVLIYPVISFLDSVGHMGSRDQLLGRSPSEEKIKFYSNELQVNKTTPPAFLVHASDDDAVKPENSTFFYNALVRNGVPAELHIYQNGGHGFGMNNKTTREQWMESLRNWLQANRWLDK
jgi:acetyl esterase/lipase